MVVHTPVAWALALVLAVAVADSLLLVKVDAESVVGVAEVALADLHLLETVEGLAMGRLAGLEVEYPSHTHGALSDSNDAHNDVEVTLYGYILHRTTVASKVEIRPFSRHEGVPTVSFIYDFA